MPENETRRTVAESAHRLAAQTVAAIVVAIVTAYVFLIWSMFDARARVESVGISYGVEVVGYSSDEGRTVTIKSQDARLQCPLPSMYQIKAGSSLYGCTKADGSPAAPIVNAWR